MSIVGKLSLCTTWREEARVAARVVLSAIHIQAGTRRAVAEPTASARLCVNARESKVSKTTTD